MKHRDKTVQDTLDFLNARAPAGFRWWYGIDRIYRFSPGNAKKVNPTKVLGSIKDDGFKFRAKMFDGKTTLYQYTTVSDLWHTTERKRCVFYYRKHALQLSLYDVLSALGWGWENNWGLSESVVQVTIRGTVEMELL